MVKTQKLFLVPKLLYNYKCQSASLLMDVVILVSYVVFINYCGNL